MTKTTARFHILTWWVGAEPDAATELAPAPVLDLPDGRVYGTTPFAGAPIYVLTEDEVRANEEALSEISEDIPALCYDGMLRVAVDEDGDVWTWCESAPASSAPGGPWEQRTTAESADPRPPLLLVRIITASDLGLDATDADVAPYCAAVESWLTEHEGDELSIHVRPARRGEVTGLYAVRGGVPSGADIHRDSEDDRESQAARLLEQAWDLWCSGRLDTDERIMLDVSDLTGDKAPASLAGLLADNEELPPQEVEALRRLRVGESARLGIGGGYVTVTRIAAPTAPALADGTPATVGLRVCGVDWRTDFDHRDIGVIREVSPARLVVAWTGGESSNDRPEYLVPAAQADFSGRLCDYETGDALGPATSDEHSASREAAECDGGAGIIDFGGRRCFVRS